MKKWILIILLALALLLPSYAENATNFAAYNLAGKRKILFQELEKLPPNGVLILNFTASYCSPCRKEIPFLMKLQIKNPAKIKLWIVYNDIDEKKVKQLAEELSITQEVLIDPLATVSRKYGIKNIPVTLLISKKGLILLKTLGYNEEGKRKLEKKLNL